ncbi:hypothetical protein O181_014540, partial [Austropuccinia psidii MF-1]|nr:hypothetical protein [Austropuccinia psidii MF-1]
MTAVQDLKAQLRVAHDTLDASIFPHPKGFLRSFFIVTTVLSPLATVVFLVTTFRKFAKGRLWVFKLKPDGHIFPNLALVNVILSLCYTIFDVTSLITLQFGLGTADRAATWALTAASFPFPIAMGWTKLWFSLQNIPFTKYGFSPERLAARRQSLLSKPLNLISAFVYTFLFVLASVHVSLLSRKVSQIESTWNEYNDSYQDLMFNDTIQEEIYNASVKNLSKLESMKQLCQQLRKIEQTAAIIYSASSSVYLLAMLLTYFYAFRPMYYHLKAFEDSITRQPLQRKHIQETRSNTYESSTFDRSLSGQKFTTPKPLEETHIRHPKRSYMEYINSFSKGENLDLELASTKSKPGSLTIVEISILQRYERQKSQMKKALYMGLASSLMTISFIIMFVIV